MKDLLEQANPELGGGGGTMPLSEAVKRSVERLMAAKPCGSNPTSMPPFGARSATRIT